MKFVYKILARALHPLSWRYWLTYKTTIIFVMSVSLFDRPSIRPHGTTRFPVDGINEIWYLSIFGKYVVKIQVSSKSDKNNGYFTWRPNYIFEHISLSSY